MKFNKDGMTGAINRAFTEGHYDNRKAAAVHLSRIGGIPNSSEPLNSLIWRHEHPLPGATPDVWPIRRERSQRLG